MKALRIRFAPMLPAPNRVQYVFMIKPWLTRLLLVSISCLLLNGCGFYNMYEAHQMDAAIGDYRAQAGQVHLGDPKDKVLALLMPTEEKVSARYRRSPEAFIAAHPQIRAEMCAWDGNEWKLT